MNSSDDSIVIGSSSSDSSSPLGSLQSLTSIPSRIVFQSCLRSSCANCFSKALLVPMMYRRFSSRKNSRLSAEVIPRSMTQIRLDLPYLLSMRSTIPLTVVTSAVFPAKTSYPSGIPPSHDHRYANLLAVDSMIPRIASLSEKRETKTRAFLTTFDFDKTKRPTEAN